MSSLGTKSTSNDSPTYEFSPSESLDSDSESVSSSHEFLNSSSSRTSLEAFPRAWLAFRLVKSAILPLILRPRCYKYIFSCVVRKRFYIFFIFPRNIRRKSVPFSYSFFRLCIQDLKVLYITFTCSLVHVELGPELLQRPFFRGGQFSLVEQFLYLDTKEKFISSLCKACNQTVYIYIDQFIAIKVNSWVFHSL